MVQSQETAYQAYMAILNEVNSGVYFTDTSRKITFWNEMAERISGFTSEEVTGSNCMDNILSHVDLNGNSICASHRCPLLHTIHSGEIKEADIVMHHKDGHRVPVHIKSLPLHDVHGSIIGGVEIFSDRSTENVDLKQLKELEEAVFLDHLTGIANRRYLENILTVRFKGKANTRQPFHLLMIDIDHFKNINDQYGHDIGDHVLKTISKSLLNAMNQRDIVARWGGDEFMILMNTDSPLQALSQANNAMTYIRNSYITHHDKKIHYSASAGLINASAYESLDEALKAVDQLMYQSKVKGRDQISHTSTAHACKISMSTNSKTDM